jgi:hypothetical protein
MMSYRNLTSTDDRPIDVLPFRLLRGSPSEATWKSAGSTAGPFEQFTERYFEELVSAVSSSQLDKIGQSLVSTGEAPNTLGVFVVDMARPEDRVDTMLFEREKSAFTRLLPTLMPRYEGQFVAVHDGIVVDSDRSSSELVRRFFRQFGDTHVYIGYVGQEEPISYAVSPFNL